MSFRAVIGEGVFCDHFVENECSVWEASHRKCGVQLWDGLRIEDDVFLLAMRPLLTTRFPGARNSPATAHRCVAGN